MTFVDRLLTIVITMTLTSAAWIVFGGTAAELASERSRQDMPANSDEPGGAGGSEDASATYQPDRTGEPGAPPAPSEPIIAANETGGGRDLFIPVEGIAADELVDSFLDRRGANGERRHEAIDIMAEAGTSVRAAAPGTVAKMHSSGPGGLSIYVRSPDRRTIHYYAHLDEYAADLREGQQVRVGQRLGTVGSTGNADPSAPHLHFQIIETTPDANWWEPGNAVNPYPRLMESVN